MLTAILTTLAPLLPAGWALRRLRQRRLLLRDLRSKYLSTLDACEDLVRQLEDMEYQAHVAALAPVQPGGKPDNAPLDLINLREEVRGAEESLQQAENEWDNSRFDQMHALLGELWAQLDTVRGGVDQFRQRVVPQAGAVAVEAATAALARRATQDQEARAGQAEEIRARIEREVPRLLAKTGPRAPAAGDLAQARHQEAEQDLQAARLALDSGDIAAADRRSRKARTRAMRLLRQIELGLVMTPAQPRSLWGSLRAALEEARLPVAAAIGWTLASMAFASWMTFTTVGRITGSTEKVLTTSGNLALHMATRASHALDIRHGSDKTVDGNLGSAWVSGASLADAQGLVIDLRAKRALGKVLVLPQAAPAGMCRWQIDVSENSWVWNRVGEGAARGGPAKSDWGVTDLPHGTQARWVRIRPIDWSRSGVAIFEIRVFAPSEVLKR